MTSRACFQVPLLVAAISLVSLGVTGWQGWPGDVGTTATSFCETLRSGPIKQPANTWSNLGFLIVGLWIGAFAARRGVEASANPMRGTVLYPMLYASVATLLGPGSMAMHASTTTWGARLDVFSMYLWISFTIAYGFVRLCDINVQSFAVGFVLLAATLGVSLFLPISGSLVFGVGVVAYAGIELVLWRQRKHRTGDRRWLAGAATAFLIAFCIWVPSHTGGALCAPDSLLQGHAIWHILDAVAVGCLYVFYRSEMVSPVPSLRS